MRHVYKTFYFVSKFNDLNRIRLLAEMVWAEMFWVMCRNGLSPKWLWAEMTGGPAR